MSVWASTDDVENTYEGQVPDRTQQLLDNAETLLRRIFRATSPTIAERILLDADEADYLDPELLKMVLVQAVIRTLRNPKGLSWEREGDYSYGLPIGRPNDVGTNLGGVWFTEQEIDLLKPTTTTWSPVGTITIQDRYAAPLAYRSAVPSVLELSDDPDRLNGPLL